MNNKIHYIQLLVDQMEDAEIEDIVDLVVHSSYRRAVNDPRLGWLHRLAEGIDNMPGNRKRLAARLAIVATVMVASGVMVWVASENWAAGVVLGILIGFLLGRELNR